MRIELIENNKRVATYTTISSLKKALELRGWSKQDIEEITAKMVDDDVYEVQV